MRITKAQLTNALMNGTPVTIGKVKFARITAIELEDGSGHKFNVTGNDYYGQRATVFTTTVD
jgi:hypothetical protein